MIHPIETMYFALREYVSDNETPSIDITVNNVLVGCVHYTVCTIQLNEVCLFPGTEVH